MMLRGDLADLTSLDPRGQLPDGERNTPVTGSPDDTCDPVTSGRAVHDLLGGRAARGLRAPERRRWAARAAGAVRGRRGPRLPPAPPGARDLAGVPAPSPRLAAGGRALCAARRRPRSAHLDAGPPGQQRVVHPVHRLARVAWGTLPLPRPGAGDLDPLPLAAAPDRRSLRRVGQRWRRRSVALRGRHRRRGPRAVGRQPSPGAEVRTVAPDPRRPSCAAGPHRLRGDPRHLAPDGTAAVQPSCCRSRTSSGGAWSRPTSGASGCRWSSSTSTCWSGSSCARRS